MTACYHASGTISGGNNNYTGGVMGANWGNSSVVTACYWSNNISVGIGNDLGSDSETAYVDGTDTDWSTAVSSMNTALTDVDWQYVDNGATNYPTLTSK